MKKLMILFLVAAVFSCDISETTSEQAGLDPQVALDVMNDYVKSCNELKDAGKWVENNSQLSKEFKNDYKKLIKEAYEADPEMGLDFDPIFDAQDYSDKGYEINSFDSRTGLVVLKGADSDEVSLQVKVIDGKCLVDGAGVIRMSDK